MKDPLYTIYSYEFSKSAHKTIAAAADQVDGYKYINQALTCLDSLFDEKKLDKLGKTTKDGFTPLPNDVLKSHDHIHLLRINNREAKKLWKEDGFDSNGHTKYKEQEEDSFPYTYVIFDNRQGKKLLAIRQSAAWGKRPDELLEILQCWLNVKLNDRFNLDITFTPCLNSSDAWEHVRERNKAGDYVKGLYLELNDPQATQGDAVNRTGSSMLTALFNSTIANEAEKLSLGLDFSLKQGQQMAKRYGRDFTAMVNLCCVRGYSLKIKFRKSGTYTVNSQQIASRPLVGEEEVLRNFQTDAVELDGRTTLEIWLDSVMEQLTAFDHAKTIKQQLQEIQVMRQRLDTSDIKRIDQNYADDELLKVIKTAYAGDLIPDTSFKLRPQECFLGVRGLLLEIASEGKQAPDYLSDHWYDRIQAYQNLPGTKQDDCRIAVATVFTFAILALCSSTEAFYRTQLTLKMAEVMGGNIAPFTAENENILPEGWFDRFVDDVNSKAEAAQTTVKTADGKSVTQKGPKCKDLFVSESIKSQEQQRFLDYLKQHNMSSRPLTCKKDDTLNDIVMSFIKVWKDRRCLADGYSNGALYRFLTGDCHLSPSIEKKSYNTKKFDYLPSTLQNVIKSFN